MLLRTRVAPVARAQGSGLVIRGDRSEQAGAAGEARDGENCGPYMTSSVAAVLVPAGLHARAADPAQDGRTAGRPLFTFCSLA